MRPLQLVRLPADVGWNEGYVIAYLATFAGEQVRQILTSKAATLRSKLDIWTQNWWNFSDSLAVVEFFVALFFRYPTALGSFCFIESTTPN